MTDQQQALEEKLEQLRRQLDEETDNASKMQIMRQIFATWEVLGRPD